jgi:hypothetical protein
MPPERPRVYPERPQLRELITEDLWERFLTAIGSLEQREQRIEELTAQVEALTAALHEATHPTAPNSASRGNPER